MLSLLFFGFLLGLRHAVEADHVAAVASLTTRASRIRDVVPLGALWGAGHALTLFGVGAVIILMDDLVPTKVANGLELAVGVMLVYLGLDVLWRLWRDRVHFHVHQHGDGVVHFHAHSHKDWKRHEPSAHEHVHPRGMKIRALLVGTMHGLAGSAAVILLTLSQFDSFAGGMLYIAVFGAGSIAGMAVLTAIISVPMQLAAKFTTLLHNGLKGTVGVVTLALGFVTILHSYAALMLP